MTSAVITIASSRYCRGSPNAATTGGSTIAAVIDASDMVRLSAKIAPNAASANKSTSGAIASHTPSAAATPLPPRNPRNTEQIDPINATSPVHAIVWIGNPAALATTTGIAPFSTSPANVIAAALIPPARATLEVPIFPDPTVRGSKPRIRPTITPVGIEPTKHARTITSG